MVSAKLKIFFDSDVLLDVLTERPHHYRKSAETLSLAEKQSISGFTSSLIICNLHYVLRKLLDERTARSKIETLLELLDVIDLRKSDITAALALPMPDFEDCVQACIASRAQMNWIITRNIQDYKKSAVVNEGLRRRKIVRKFQTARPIETENKYAKNNHHHSSNYFDWH